MTTSRSVPSIAAPEAVTVLNALSNPATPWQVVPENTKSFFAADGEFVLIARTADGREPMVFRTPNPNDPQGPQWAFSWDHGGTFEVTADGFTEFVGKLSEILAAL